MVSGGRQDERYVARGYDPAGLEEHRAEPAADPENARELVGSGRVLLDLRVAIVEPESAAALPEGRVGEIWVAGDSVARGYWNRPEESDRTFGARLAGLAGDNATWLRTGDLGFLDRGELFITGRLKDLIILRGRNHYPQDIEQTAERAHPAVRSGSGAAFSVEIEGEERLVVVYEVDRHAEALGEIAEAVRRAVAEEHEALVHEVVLVPQGGVPKTTSGKIQRRGCRELYLAGELHPLGSSRLEAAAEPEPAEGPLRDALLAAPGPQRMPIAERWLARAFARIARIDSRRLDPERPLTGFGLDSLVAVELKNAVEDEVGVALPIAGLLEGMSLREAALRIVDPAVAGAPDEMEIVPGPAAGEHPLSWGQRSLWFLHRLAPESAAYNIAGAARLAPGTDRAALARALQLLVDRHPGLRATFASTPEGAVQRIAERADVALLREDARGWSEEELLARLRQEAFRPFDLERGPVFRAALFEREEGDRLALAVHHVAADFWSLAVMARELGALYLAFHKNDGEAAGLPEPALHYTDFARWQERRLEGPWGEALWEHWRRRLAGSPPLDLATDRPRPPAQTFRGAEARLRLGRERTDRLQALAAAHGSTLFVALLAAWQALLGRHASQDDFLVGSPTTGRSASGLGGRLAGVVGYFVNLVALRADLAGDPAVPELLERARGAALDALEHADFPFARLAERLQPARDASRPPLASTVLALQKSPAPELAALAAFAVGEAGVRLDLGGLTLESIPLESETAQFDLTLLAAEMEGELAFNLQFNTDLFEAVTAERMLARLAELLGSMTAAPGRRLSELEILPASEREQLRAAAATGPGLRDGVPVHRIVEEWAARTPERLAVTDASEALTYGELNARANRLARRLRGLGVGPETTVAVCVERSAALVVAQLAVLKAGAAHAPLDPAYPEERRAYMVEDSRAPVVLTRREVEAAAAGEDPGNLEVPVDGGNTAYVIYTSGSTGRPKGVQISHANLANLIAWALELYAFTPEDRGSMAVSPSFDVSQWEIWSVLAAGASLHVPDEETRTSPARLAGWLAETAITNCFLPTPLAEALLEEPWPAASRIRNFGCGGDRLRRAPGPGSPFRLFNLYGPAECAVVSTGGVVQESAAPLAGDASIGFPVPGSRIHLLGRHGETMPPGAPGEIFIGGLGVGRGYLGRPALTAERFVPDPFADEPGARLYRTGDLGRFRPDGSLDFLGRIDRQVKIRGVRIELGEVEAALAALPAVREAVAEARSVGSGAPVLVAWVVLREEESDLRELAAALRRTLPETMVPTFFVPLAALPLTANGKIDRKALPDPAGLAGDGIEAGPRTATEEALAGIWSALLGVERVGSHDGFFELGGHSLLAARMISRVQAALGVELPLAELFANPTLGELAAAVERARGTAAAPPIPRISHDGDLPLSFAQERLWFLERLAAGTPAYNVPAFLRLRGPLDVEALRAALTGIARRHETLRTTFPEVGGEPVQRIAPPAPFPLAVEDLAGAPDPEAAARRRAGEEAARPFDLQNGPLARAVLLRLTGDDHVLGLTLHHAVTDGWSTEVLLRELTALYGGAELPELPVQYADYAVWQRSWLAGDALAARLDHWRRRLDGAPAALELPADRPRPAAQSFRGGLARLPLGRDLSAALAALGRERGATPFMTLLAAFQALLGRYTDRQDLLVGAPAANRGRPEVEGLIGFFVNLLALRAGLGGDPSFAELLDRTRRAALEDFAHDDLPFEKVVDAVAPGRDLSRAPLVQVVFALQPALPPLELAPGLRVELEEVHNGTSKFDLTLFVEEGADGFEARAEYASDLFDAATAGRLLGHLRVLLEGVAASPGTPVSGLPLLTAAERRMLTAEWSATAPGAEPFLVHERIAEWAARAPERPALVAAGETLTYGEMDRRANRLAHALIARGAGPERVVAVCLERSPAAVVACLAALKAGAAYAPLDPVHPPERLAGMVADAGATVVLTRGEVAARVAFPAPVLALGGESLEGFSESGPGVRPDPEGLAYVIFTSGSTGRPKGSGVRHTGLANLCVYYAATTGMGPEDRLSQVAAPGFDVAVGELWPTLAAGASLHFAPDEAIGSPPLLLDWLRREAVTVCFLPTPLMELVIDEPAAADLGVRWFYTGGDRLTRRPPAAAAWKLWNIYGPSECTVVSTSWVVEPAGEGLPPIGVPVPGARVYLLDRNGLLAPPGVPGEIWVGGVPVGRGYLGRPELTADRFRPDPFGSDPFGPAGARLYRTGDLARFRADGRLEYLGRIDHQVKIRGFRVELGEVEAALLALPQVREGVVVAREYAPGDKRLVAYVAGRDGTAPGALAAAELRDQLRRTLPEGMVPSAFVALPALPLSANGKVDRKALPAPDWEGSGEAGGGPRTPRTMTEEMLAGIWAELLGRGEVGVDDDFFESGGHSLLAARLTGRLRAAFGVELPLAEVFAHPTVASLARAVEQARRGGAPAAPPVVPARREGPLPLSFAQERLWFLDQLEGGGALYNVPVALRLRGPLDAGRLAAALRAIALRHESLRTTFPDLGGRPAQAISPEPGLELARLELDEAAALAAIGEEARRPFDLANGPLARAVLIRLGDGDHLLALTFHHTVADGGSVGVLFRELAALYSGESLPGLPVQYADYAIWQRGWLRGEVLDAQLAFWRDEFATPPAPLDLATDRPRPAAQTFRGGAVPVELPAELVRGARDLARRRGATAFMTLLAAWAAVLHRWSGQEEIAIGTPVANRRPEVEGLIGFFVNTLPLRAEPAAGRPFAGLLAAVRERALGAYAHQDVPFERLVEELAPGRDLSRGPLFQVMFALEDGPGVSLRLPGIAAEGVPVHTGTAKFELTLALAGDGDGLAGGLEYNADLFDAATARRMAGHLAILLAGAVADPDRELADLPLLAAAEARQVLTDWNATAAPFPRGSGLHELFEEQAARTPEATALIWGEERLSYRELDGRAGRLARRLRTLGVGPETLVGIYARRTPAMVAAMIAVMKAGGAYVPLDPAYPAERVALLLTDTAAPVLITEGELARALPPYGGRVVLLEDPGDGEGGELPRGLVDADQIAYTIYTSGSTGLPKAVLIRHSSAVAMISWALAAYPAEALGGVLASTSICFDISVFEIFAPLAGGGTVILADDALALAELPAASEVRLIDTVPSAMAELLRAGAVPPSVRIVNLAGEPLRRDLVSRVYELPHVEAVYNLYGPSEDTTFSTTANPRRGETREPTIGRPIANGRIYVLDRRLRPAPVGVPGEVWIAGAGLARGYLNRPELTADRFRPDPFAAEPGARLYQVGDLARYLPDGELEFLGRLDHQVKIRGFRVELGEIEAALTAHPRVREAVVIAREEGATRALAAFVVADAEEGSAEAGLIDELRRHLAQRLPPYMVPAGFQALPALPLTPNGKVDRKALARLESGAAPAERGGYVEPRNPIEELLLPLWTEVLGRERIGVFDDFFALGGHSLLGVQLISRVRDLFGVRLPVRTVFSSATIAELAERIAEEMAALAGDELLDEAFTGSGEPPGEETHG